MRFPNWRVLWGLLLLIGMERSASAEERPTHHTLPAVTVTAPPIPDNPAGADALRVGERMIEESTNSLFSLTYDEIHQQTLPTTGELFSVAPNAVSFDGGSRSFGNILGMRGITNSLQFSTPAITMYLDGVPLARVRQFPPNLLGTRSAEIFRGPQVTRFGTAGEVGILSIETGTPGSRWNFEATGSYASHQEQTYSALTGGSLAPGFSAQFGGFYGSDDGYIENTLLGGKVDPQETYGGQAKLLWKASENTELALLFWFSESEDGAPRLVPLGTDPLNYSTDVVGESHNTNLIGAVRLRHSEETWELSAVASGQWWELDPYRFDADFSPFNVAVINIPMNEEVWIGEINVASKGDVWSNISWRAGISGALDTWNFDNERVVSIPAFEDSSTQSIESQRVSLYGMVAVPLAERFRAWVGGRVTWHWEQAAQQYTGPVATNARFDRSNSDLLLLPDAGVEFRYDDETLFYAKCAGGGKPGGFTPFFGSPVLQEYEKETLLNGEIGLKRAWFQNRLTLQAAAFYYAVENYQFESALTAGNYSIFNIPEASGFGGEVECIAAPIDSLEIGIGFGFTRTNINSGTDPVTGLSVEGNRIPYAPLFTASGNVTWRPWEGWLLFVEGLVVGDSYATLDNSARFEQETYATLNLKIGYEWEHAGIYFVANNLTDTQYYSIIAPNLGAAGVGAPGEPRSLGMRMTVRY